MNEHKIVLNATEFENALRRIAYQILDKYPSQPLAFVGVYQRGVSFANRVAKILSETRSEILQGTLDISLYRDDRDNLGTIPAVTGSDLPFAVEGSTIILFDDVLFTGRTIRAAIEEIIDYGRPARIELAVLIDRGHRELPICPDYTGRGIQTSTDEYVSVRFMEDDGNDEVAVWRGDEDDA